MIGGLLLARARDNPHSRIFKNHISIGYIWIEDTKLIKAYDAEVRDPQYAYRPIFPVGHIFPGDNLAHGYLRDPQLVVLRPGAIRLTAEGTALHPNADLSYLYDITQIPKELIYNED